MVTVNALLCYAALLEANLLNLDRWGGAEGGAVCRMSFSITADRRGQQSGDGYSEPAWRWTLGGVTP